MVGRIVLPVVLGALVGSSVWADDTPPAPDAPVVVLPPYTAPAPVAQPAQPTQPTYPSGPEEITEIVDGRPPPVGYTAVQRRRKGLIIGGAITLGVSYAVAADVASGARDLAGTGSTRNDVLYIPVAGPFIEIGRTTGATARLLLGGLGAAELTGAVLLYFGLTTTKTVFVRNDLVGLSIMPLAGGTSGVALSGRF